MSQDAEGTGKAARLKPEVLEALARHGLAPKATSSPERLREFLNDLYRYEIRRLRARLRRREFPQGEYLGRVVELRKRYPLMSIPVQYWLENP